MKPKGGLIAETIKWHEVIRGFVQMDNACTYEENEKYHENSLWDRQEPFGPWVTEKHCLVKKNYVHVSVSREDQWLKPSEKSCHCFQKNKIAYFLAEI